MAVNLIRISSRTSTDSCFYNEEASASISATLATTLM